MIDMNPSDTSCIYSTWKFVCSEARRNNTKAILTFDQPLYWKALMIVLNEPDNSDLKTIILRLGGFHLQMSFLGCIGYIMDNSGLRELLETIYAANTVNHMLTGKAVARALRGHFLVDNALNYMIVSKVLKPKLNNHLGDTDPETERGDAAEEMQSVTTATDDQHIVMDDDRASGSQECNDNLLSSVGELYDGLIDKTISPEVVCESTLLDDINHMLEVEKQSLSQTRTGSLWLQYMGMVDLLRLFIKAERTGNWDLHLATVNDMLPFFAAAGHNLYLKSAYIYLQQMLQLKDDHPDVHTAFQNGHHVIRRSNRFWAGLPSDLVIEQALMRSVKTTGGLTRGRGMTAAERARWILSMPACAGINSAVQELCGIDYQTSSQHKESSEARKERDHKDVFTLISFLENRYPFAEDPSLRNIETGVIAAENVNVDNARTVGSNIVQKMVGKTVADISFRRSEQAVTMNAKMAVKVDGDSFEVDPQLLFQQLLIASDAMYDDKSEIFRFELCSQPSSLFDSSGLMRQANKALLADAMWNLGDCSTEELPSGFVQYVLDGGSLIQRLPWRQGESFNSICNTYLEYVSKRYCNAVIVFDGYSKGSSTKDTAHIKRSKGVVGSTVIFSADMPCRSRKDVFLANKDNKQRFINMIGQKMEERGFDVTHADDDADLMIVKRAVECANDGSTVVVGEDTDLLVLLCYHASATSHDIYFMSEKSKQKIWDIKKTKSVLGMETCNHLLFVHAISGCDTTSHPFGISKGVTLKKMLNDDHFKKQGEVFTRCATESEIVQAGEEALICLYGGIQGEKLDVLRARKFFSKVASSKTSVKLQALPPTSAAARYHSLRVFLQVQQWVGARDDLVPHDWGWYIADEKLMPIKTNMPPAPEMLLKVIRCKCKTNCDTKRCTCRKHGLECSTGCGECRGTGCTNAADYNIETDDEM
ncbi:hypothetical protein HOLleu_10106 [Holothuria leucospilota]|uniref:Tesmin/TSO1-like CXC domain-containing protein n=1 Tax=Holothuria leucospilota TaxID=206669 RepID=A0A9Q1CCK5_HOLLE|nr:hypothetical protein HOLleu_10106 [Holothuria leucospilota]